MRLRAAIVSVVGVTAAAFVSVSAAGVSRQEADALSRKIDVIVGAAAVSRPSIQGGGVAQGRRTMVSEGEINSWFAFKAAPYLPAGVTNPTVTLVGNGEMIGGAVVDLDAVARGRRGILDPLSFLGGKLPVSIVGMLNSKDGQGRFEIRSAEISGVPVPAVVVEELIAYYARSSDNPDGIRLGTAFDLPANIRQIEMMRGQMVVVQ